MRLRNVVAFGALAVAVFAQPRSAAAQAVGPAADAAFVRDLPDAPLPVGRASGQQSVPEAPSLGTSVISGEVRDVNGGLVPGARIVLKGDGKIMDRDTLSNASGGFRFSGLPQGTYVVFVSAAGLERFASSRIVLAAGEHFELPEVALVIATARTEVNVTMTETQLAAVEVKAEEKQRVLGVFPNFYTSFVWNAAPMNAQQKFDLVAHATLDPVELITTGIVAGIEQARNTFPEYGQGAEGFGKRYGAAFADDTIGKVIGRAILPSVFRQDPRYFVMGTGTTKQRVLHALAFGVLCRGDNGRQQINFSHLGGNAAAGAISTLYRPDTDSAGELAGIDVLLGIGGDAVQGLTREFLFKKFTKNVPAFASGKPQGAADTPATIVPEKSVPSAPTQNAPAAPTVAPSPGASAPPALF